MPIYEYGCPGCRRKHSIFFRSQAAVEADPACPDCGKRGMVKLVSRVAAPRSDDARMEAMADAAGFSGVDENDPRSVARWAREMGGAFGDDLGEDFDEAVDEMAGAGEGDGAGPGGEWSPGPF